MIARITCDIDLSKFPSINTLDDLRDVFSTGILHPARKAAEAAQGETNADKAAHLQTAALTLLMEASTVIEEA